VQQVRQAQCRDHKEILDLLAQQVLLEQIAQYPDQLVRKVKQDLQGQTQQFLVQLDQQELQENLVLQDQLVQLVYKVK
jgi:hypothetical protein